LGASHDSEAGVGPGFWRLRRGLARSAGSRLRRTHSGGHSRSARKGKKPIQRARDKTESLVVRGQAPLLCGESGFGLPLFASHIIGAPGPERLGNWRRSLELGAVEAHSLIGAGSWSSSPRLLSTVFPSSLERNASAGVAPQSQAAATPLEPYTAWTPERTR